MDKTFLIGDFPWKFEIVIWVNRKMEENKIDVLPDEILEYILSLIPPYKDLQECLYVSKRWYQATKSKKRPLRFHA